MPGMLTRLFTTTGGRSALFLTGLTLLASAAVVRRQTRRAEAENPPTGRFLDIDGVHLHVVERGTGDPIILLHGNGSLIQDFALAGVIDGLAENHRVIAFDRPGFGYTNRPTGRIWNADAQAALIHAAMHALDIDAAVVVGHSWGTMVATALALAHPESVKRLVLISGYYFPTPRLDVPFAAVPAIPGIGTLLRHTLSPLIGRAMWPALSRMLFGPADITPGFRQWPVWMTLRPEQLRASAADTAMMIPQAIHMADRYGELNMPVTVLAGDGDLIVNTAVQSVRLQERLLHGTLQVVPGAGHMLHHIAPAIVIAAIKAQADTGNPAAPVQRASSAHNTVKTFN